MLLMVSYLPEIKRHIGKELVAVHHLPDIKNLVKAVRKIHFVSILGLCVQLTLQNILIELHFPYFYLLCGCLTANFGPMSRGKAHNHNVYLCLFDI